MQPYLKTALETFVASTGVPALVRRVNSRRVLILAYHNVVPDGGEPGGDRSLHLPVEDFRRQLDLLQQTHEVVSLESLPERSTRRERRPVAIVTFDDAYRGAVTCGVAELKRRGLPATIFVAPSFLGGRTFWWDRLGEGATGVPHDFRAHALDVLRGEDARISDWARSAGIVDAPVPEHARGASELELLDALDHPGVTLGSHTWSHPNLARLGEREILVELERSLAHLRSRFTRVIPWLSYPYGLSSPLVERVAARAGYEGALLVTGGAIGPSARRSLALPRLNVPAGVSVPGFILRTAGILSE